MQWSIFSQGSALLVWLSYRSHSACHTDVTPMAQCHVIAMHQYYVVYDISQSLSVDSSERQQCKLID